MSLLKQMKNLENLTEREQDISRYIMQNLEQIETMSSRELSNATITSAASVTRFCQKLGVKGFPELAYSTPLSELHILFMIEKYIHRCLFLRCCHLVR